MAKKNIKIFAKIYEKKNRENNFFKKYRYNISENFSLPICRASSFSTPPPLFLLLLPSHPSTSLFIIIFQYHQHNSLKKPVSLFCSDKQIALTNSNQMEMSDDAFHFFVPFANRWMISNSFFIIFEMYLMAKTILIKTILIILFRKNSKIFINIRK